MSVIVLLKDKNRYVVGCDTRCSDSYSFIDSYQASKKARHIDFNNEIIIGAVRRDNSVRLTGATNKRDDRDNTN